MRSAKTADQTLTEMATNYPVHNISPAFHRHTLEHGEHREAEVIEVCDATVRPFPAVSADQVITMRCAFHSASARMNRINSDLI